MLKVLAANNFFTKEKRRTAMPEGRASPKKKGKC
jgi:hypothetical protein